MFSYRRGATITVPHILARHWFPLVVLAALFLLGVYWSATYPLWLDEIYTYHILKGGDLGDVWQRMKTGPQADPPLFCLAARASIAVFGDCRVAFRLPGTVGILVMALAIYVLVARSSSAAYARLAMLLALFPPVLAHLANARPYGLWLGWSGLALLCWQGAGEWAGVKRMLALLGLACCCAGSVATHYYAVLFLAALAGAEMFRSWRLRRVDVFVWLTFVPAVFVLVALAPLIENSKSFIEDSWAAPKWFRGGQSLFGVLKDLFASVPHLVLFAAIIWLAKRGRQGAAKKATASTGPPSSLLGAAGAVTAVPFLGFLLAIVYTKNYTARYVLPAACGLAVLIPLIVHRRTRGQAKPATLLVGLSAILIGYTVVVAFIMGPPAAHFPKIWSPIREIDNRGRASDSFLITNSLSTFIETKFAHPEVRILFVRLLARRSTNEVARRLKRWYPDILELEELERFDRLLLARKVSGKLLEYIETEQGSLVARPALRSGDAVYEVDGRSLVRCLYDSPLAVMSRSVRETPPP